LRRDGRTLHFTLQRGRTLEDVQAAVPGATLLWPDQSLDWPGLPDGSGFVIPLLDRDSRTNAV
jgi:hypothetical protein